MPYMDIVVMGQCAKDISRGRGSGHFAFPELGLNADFELSEKFHPTAELEIAVGHWPFSDQFAPFG